MDDAQIDTYPRAVVIYCGINDAKSEQEQHPEAL